MIKDPSTGRRVARPNRKDQHRSVDAPHLAIIDDAIFKAAQAIKAGRSHQGALQSRKAVRPLSGLLRCGSCGAGMSAIGAPRKGKPHRMQCSAFRESGICSNGRKVSRQAIETLVFEGLRDELANPEAIAEYVRTYNAERRRLAKVSGDREKHLQRRKGELDREIDRLITNISKGADFDLYNPKVNELAAERKRVEAELTQIASSSEIVTVHPAAVERYLADIRRLADVAAEAAELDEPELVLTLRQLVQTVTVFTPPGTDELTIEIKASLSDLTLPGPLLKRSIGGGVTVGSGGGTRTPDPRIMIPVL